MDIAYSFFVGNNFDMGPYTECMEMKRCEMERNEYFKERNTTSWIHVEESNISIYIYMRVCVMEFLKKKYLRSC